MDEHTKELLAQSEELLQRSREFAESGVSLTCRLRQLSEECERMIMRSNAHLGQLNARKSRARNHYY